jgi:hypothetical protein
MWQCACYPCNCLVMKQQVEDTQLASECIQLAACCLRADYAALHTARACGAAWCRGAWQAAADIHYHSSSSVGRAELLRSSRH